MCCLRKFFCGVSCTATLAMFLMWSCLLWGADQGRWNVLLIVADDLRVELGCYGSPAITPNLDRLARNAVRFERAYCQQALCNPSRSSFLTGLRPNTLRLWNNGTHFRELNPGVVTLPQYFRQHGYQTRCIGKIFHNWHTRQKGDPVSWSAPEFLHYANHGDDEPQVPENLPPNLAEGIGRMYGKVPVCECRDVPDEAYFDGRVAAEAVRVLHELKEQPFFLAVGFWKPHAPFNAPKRYWDLYHREALPRLVESPPQGVPLLALHDSREILGIGQQRVTPTASQAAEMRHGYFANISYMDAQVGKVLDALDRLDLRSKTVVVFLSDHGYHIGEHTLWGKTSCFEYDARVPLLIALPNAAAAGGVAAGMVELIDLFPTLIELCGLPPLAELEGTSLVPVLRDPKLELKQAAYTQHPRPAYYDRTETGLPEAMGYSVRTAWGRYTEWRDWTTGRVVAAEFYDHANDPFELMNLADQPLASVEASRRLLRAVFP